MITINIEGLKQIDAMKDYPFISIMILSYNGMFYLKNCLDSVFDQDYPSDRFEVIVADNGSLDDSVIFLRSNYKDLKIIEFDVNHGFAKGNNLAIEHARGDLLVFLNQDTIVHKKWLSGLVKGIVADNYDVCQSNMLLPRNEEFEGIHKKEIPRYVYYYELTKYGYVNQIIKDYNDNIIETKFVSGASFIIKKMVLQEIQYLFDENLVTYHEDMDLSLRLRQKGFKVGVVPSSVVYHLSSFKVTYNKYNIWKNLIMIRNRMMVFRKALRGRFILFLPILLISQSHKVFTRSIELENSFIKSFFLACSVLPLSLIGFLWFIFSLPRVNRQVSN